MHDFRQKDPEAMHNRQLGDTTRYFKKEGGRSKMSTKTEEIMNDIIEKKAEVILETIIEKKCDEKSEQKVVDMIKRLLQNATPSELIRLGLTKEELALAQNN